MDRGLPFSRWWLVAFAAAAMGSVGTYQFVWSSLRAALGTRLAAPEAALGTAFTLFVVAQTIAQFPAGHFRDRHGPRIPMIVGTALLGLGYAGIAGADSIEMVYVFYTVGGIGGALVYTVTVNTPVKWFDEHRGLATGTVTMAYSGVSVAVIPFVRGGIDADFGGTLLVVAGAVTIVCLAATVVIRDPPRDGEESSDDDPADDDGPDDGPDDGVYTWRETIRTWQFWLLYAVFVVIHGVGLMVIGKAVSFALELGLSAAVATGAASLIALADGAGVIVVSGLSDRVGRERSVGASLLLSGLALAGAVGVGLRGAETAFVLLLGAAAFFRSPVFGIFPTLTGEYFGERYASENYALLYSSKIWGGIVGGAVTSLLIAAIGWTPSFLIGAGLLSTVGIAAFFLRPV